MLHLRGCRLSAQSQITPLRKDQETEGGTGGFCVVYVLSGVRLQIPAAECCKKGRATSFRKKWVNGSIKKEGENKNPTKHFSCSTSLRVLSATRQTNWLTGENKKLFSKERGQQKKHPRRLDTSRAPGMLVKGCLLQEREGLRPKRKGSRNQKKEREKKHFLVTLPGLKRIWGSIIKKTDSSGRERTGGEKALLLRHRHS